MYKIYIPHYTKLADRKIILQEHLYERDIKNFTFFEEYDQEFIDESSFSFEEILIRKKIKDFIPEGVILSYLKDKLNKAEKSIALKHKFIYKKFLEEGDCEYLIILEDDVLLIDNFKLVIEEILSSKKYECLNFGAGTQATSLQSINKKPEKFNTFLSNNHAFSRGIEGYALRRDVVEKISTELDNTKIYAPIDWVISSIFNQYSICCYNVFPFLVYQKSFLGIYKSSIREDRSEFLK